jgi:hypothetical protein
MTLWQKSLMVMLHMLHITIIVFCVVGWLLPSARPWHLMLCVLILASWFGLGLWKGWGYCLVTDMQWRLMRRLGEVSPPFGYVPMLWQRITGRSVNVQRVDQVTEWVFYFSMLASLWVNWAWLRAFIE